MENHTSIRQLIVDIVNECVELPAVEEGIVIKEKPITITLVQNKKMEYSDDDLIIPERLRDHMLIIEEGKNQRKVKVLNALKTGDRVNLLLLNNGSIGYVLDRI